MTAEEIICAWIRSDACGVGLKMMLDRGSVQPLMEAIDAQFAALRRENDDLRAAAEADKAEVRIIARRVLTWFDLGDDRSTFPPALMADLRRAARTLAETGR